MRPSPPRDRRRNLTLPPLPRTIVWMSTAQPAFRSGFVAVAGRPSTGKSSLINTALGQPVAPVSPRPQTTRRRQLGILTLPHAQVVLVDTPGIHTPHDRLGERMVAVARDVISDADVILMVFDLSASPSADDELAAERVRASSGSHPILLALNKSDLVEPSQLSTRAAAYAALFPEAEAWAVSAIRGDACASLFERLVELLPIGPQYYPAEELTPTYERDLAGELIRAAAMSLLHGEIPHSLAVEVEEFKERSEERAYVSAVLFVERESQKAIVIGRHGRMIQEIGTKARKLIEDMSGRQIYLDLYVKVLRGWRQSEGALQQFGYLSHDQ
jgi:GTP-binding protein Era